MDEPPHAVTHGVTIEVNDVVRRFGGGVTALAGVNLEVLEGELVGLIGPDGAGKTTLCDILAGVGKPTSGAASILGKSAHQVRHEIGYLTQHFSLYGELSIEENLEYCGAIRSVPRAERHARSEMLLEKVGLLQFKNRLARQLSGGMKQKLALCTALIGKPAVLILDEPTTGLDPVSRREFWHLLASLSDDESTTIVVATPQFDEAELCDRVALMHAGRLLQVGRPDELREKLALTRVEVRAERLMHIQDSLLLSRESDADAATLLDVHLFGDRLDILTSKPEAVDDLLQRKILSKSPATTAQEERGASPADSCDASSVPCEVNHCQPTLENVYLMNLRAVGLTDIVAPEFPYGKAPKSVEAKSVSPAIRAVGLGKSFQGFEAVRNLNLRIHRGEIYGLLGANGAGKTTAIHMLCGLLQPTSGRVYVGDSAAGFRKDRSRFELGYMSQKYTLYDDLTVSENLEFYARSYAIPIDQQKSKMHWVMDMCNLHGTERTLVGQLPRGLKQRIAFGASVMHEPSVLLLDEPTAGIDPLARRQLWHVIRQFAERGTAILVTPHFLNDAEYCNRLGLMVQGELVAEGSPTQIKYSAGSIFEIFTPDVQKAFDALSHELDPSLLSILPGRLHVQVNEELAFRQHVIDVLKAAGVSVRKSQVSAPSLEDAFVSTVHRRRCGP